MARLVMGQLYFGNDATSRQRAAQLLAAARGLMQHTKRHGAAGPDEATSWMAIYDVDDATGALTFVDASHLGPAGPVNGMPAEPA